MTEPYVNQSIRREIRLREQILQLSNRVTFLEDELERVKEETVIAKKALEQRIALDAYVDAQAVDLL